MKNTLEWMNSRLDETEYRISDLEGKVAEEGKKRNSKKKKE